MAVADGIVTGVKETAIGGKVVWLKVNDRNITLYYAHLDKQLVQERQAVKKGETLGLIGNTGNAKNTPSHLHFGVYTYVGPIDPFPFVNGVIKTSPAVPDKKLTNYLKLKKAFKLGEGKEVIKSNTLLVPMAVNSNVYIAELPDGRIVQMSFAVVQSSSQPIRSSEILAGKAVKDSKSKRVM